MQIRKFPAYLIALVLLFQGSQSFSQPTETQPMQFAENVVLHVVLHELGHALIREFDLPILGNEETMADAFATHYLTHHIPDRAVDVLRARIRSLMIEAKEIPRSEWTVAGEHNNDARRAHQIAALAVAADKKKFGPLAKELGMSDRAISNASDYGTEIHRSWRRILKPLMMPPGMRSREARMQFDPSSDMIQSVRTGRLGNEIEKALARFDWHSQVTVSLIEGDGGAAWSRSKRTITVHTEYIERFIRQGSQ